MQAGLDIMCITIIHPCDYRSPALRPFRSAKSYGFMVLWLENEGRAQWLFFRFLLTFKLAYYLCYTRSRIPKSFVLTNPESYARVLLIE